MLIRCLYASRAVEPLEGGRDPGPVRGGVRG